MNGTNLANIIKQKIQDRIQTYTIHRKPTLATILVGDNPASKTYVAMKQKAATQVGIETICLDLPTNTTQENLEQCISKLNNDDNVDGILLQLPLTPHLKQQEALDKLKPEKDVDGLTALSGGFLMTKDETNFVTCTPASILHLLEEYKVNITGENIVIINNSTVIGRPLSQLLLNRGATVTVCNSHTRDLAFHTRNADIVITAVGKYKLLTADMIKENCIVIDAGYCRVNGKLCGDTDFEEVIKKVKLITPPVGGVGPLTIAFLLKNTLYAFEKKFNPNDRQDKQDMFHQKHADK